jgi:glycosyltransferase involved in cell wall biosynthesis
MGVVTPGRVSVVIPVFNGQRFLQEAVQSAIAARWNDKEILIVDDGSTDETPRIAERLRAAHPEFIRVLSHPARCNRGVGASRNLGARESTGEFLAFLDSDDRYLPNHLECAVTALQQDPLLAFTYSRVKIIEVMELRAPLGRSEWGSGPESGRFDHSVDRLLEANFIPTSTVVFRADMFRETDGFDEDLEVAEDYVLWTKCGAIHPVFYTNAATVEYRIHPASYTTQHANAVFASQQELEYLRRVVPWLHANRCVTKDRIDRAVHEVASRILYRCYVAIRGGHIRGVVRELLALIRVRPRRALLGGLSLWILHRRGRVQGEASASLLGRH